MRISTQQIYHQFTRSLNRQQLELNSTQLRIQTGKKDISTDGVALAKSIQLNAEKQKNESYLDTMALVDSRLQLEQKAVESLVTEMNRMKQLAINASSDTFNDNDMLQSELKNMRDTLVDITNTKQNDEFIFSGNSVHTPSLDDMGNWNGDTNQRSVKIADESTVQFGSVTGNELFSEQLFDKINNTISQGELDPELLKQVNQTIDNMALSLAGIGTHMNHIDTQRQVTLDHSLIIEEKLVNTEDADLAESISKLMAQQTAMQASMKTFNQLTSMSLFDMM